MALEKLAVGVGISSLLVLGGGYGIYDSISWIMPTNYVFLSKNSKSSDHTTANKVGKDYGRYLIGYLMKKMKIDGNDPIDDEIMISTTKSEN